MVKVTFKKANGEIFSRTRNTFFSYRIGDTTPIGWKVLNIEYRLNNKYYNKNDYDLLVEKNINKDKKILFYKQKVKLIYRYLNHILITLILLKTFEITINNVV